MPNDLLKQLLAENPEELSILFADAMPADLADALAALSDEDLLTLLPHIEPAMLAIVVQEFDEAQANRLLTLISPELAVQIVHEMSSDDAVDMLRSLPLEQVASILEALPPDSVLCELLTYEAESSGSIMATEFLTVQPEWTIHRALQVIRADARYAETAYYLYVTDKQHRLVGVLSLRDLVLAQPTARVGDIMRTNIIKIMDDADQEEAAALIRRYDLIALPVVDENDILKGIVTTDDIIDVVDEEATEDIQRMAAMQPSDTPYLTTPITKLAGQRLGWLLFLMISATFTGQIMRQYEDLLAQIIFLSVFIPMLMDTGGNAGAQSSTLIIRGLALGNIKVKDWWKVIRRELTVSILVGVSLAVVNFARIMLIEKYPADIAFVVSLTLVITLVLAKVVGGILPILAELVNIDPAIMAGPLITTIVDALALIAYFKIASMFLGAHFATASILINLA